MARYRRLRTDFHSHKKTAGLSPLARDLMIQALLGGGILGCIERSKQSFAKYAGGCSTKNGVEDAICELTDRKIAVWWNELEILWVVEAADEQCQNGDAWKSASDQWKELPEDVRRAILKRYNTVDAFVKHTVPTTVSTTVVYQEQYQEQEQKQEQNPPTPHGGGTGEDVKGCSQGTPAQQNVEVKMGFLMGLCSQRLFVGKPETYRRNIRLAAARGKPWEEIERMIRAAEPGAKVWDVLGGGGNNGEEERDVRKILERANRKAQENRA